jgi:RNA polymerase sigma factor (sigma-70 family)
MGESIPIPSGSPLIDATCSGSEEHDNAAFVEALKEGKRHAAFSFCDRYGPRINRWVWRLLGGDREHDEVVQQVYLSVFSSLSNLKKADALDAFVDSVTIRTIRKEIRWRQYRRKLFGSQSDTKIDDARDSRRPLKEAHIRACYAVLDDIGADERVVLVLKHFEGLTLEEIAEIGGYSLRTAKRRLQKGYAAFRERALKETVLVTFLEEF